MTTGGQFFMSSGGQFRMSFDSEVENIAQVVLIAEATNGERDDSIKIARFEADRPADPNIEHEVLVYRARDDAVGEIGLDERTFSAAVAHVQGGVRPGRLSEVLDCGADASAPFHQQYVAGA